MQKLLFYLLLLLLFHGMGLAQPVLDASSLNTIGDQIHRQPCQWQDVSEGAAGAGQTWNFSAVKPKIGHDYTIFYVDPAETPNSNLFPFANLATRYTDAGGTVSYAYFNQTGAEYWYLGATVEENSEVLSAPNLLARVPMVYGQNLASSYEGEQDLVSYQAAIYGNKNMLYDGYGVLMLPGITYNNAIRTKTTETRTDSITSFSGGVYTLNRTNSITYGWFVQGIKSAVFEIRYSTLTTITQIPGFPPQQTVHPTEKVVTLQLNPATSGTDFPVQFSTALRLSSANPSASGQWLVEATQDVTLVVCDAWGRPIFTQSESSNQFPLDGSQWPAGTYWVVALNEKRQLVSSPLAIVKM
ncbi:MAG: hypothetical protein J0M29_05365 [Chitinophagales bacterium]|nr:hypothetical protein [Chitinophagales bacterium]